MLKLFFKYFRFLKPYYPYIFLILFGDFIVANFALVTPLFSKILFDYAYPLRDLFLLNVIIFSSVGLYFLEFFINVMDDYLGTYVNQSFTFDLTRKIFDKCQRLPLTFHAKKSSGDLVNRLTYDTDMVVDRSIEVVLEIFIKIYTLLSILIIAFLLNYKITLLALLAIPLYFIETKFFAKKEEALEEESIHLNSDYFNALHERFKNIKTIKAYGNENAETKNIISKRRLMNVVAIKQGLVSIVAVFANSITIRMWTIFITWYMGFLVINRQLSLGEIVAMIGYVAMIHEPIEGLSRIYGNLKVAMVSFRRLDEILNADTEHDNSEIQNDLKITEGNITFKNVHFSYSASEKEILNDLSFKLNPKSAVAIVGESGSGKSTITSLMMRFYGINSGGIYIDGQKISEVRLRSLRNQVGLVLQDYTLFAGSIRENIMYGNEGKSEEDMINASKKAQIYDFINDLEDKFETMVGFEGEGLSGGQRQRIAIARVLLKDPPVIIFDEVTSALDPESEFKLTEVINDLISQKNLFIIAHRLSTIKKVDLILMLENGKIVEQGTFHELIDKKGAFFRYYSMQFGGFEVFKKILEIEYERVNRYGSRFNLAAVEALSFHKILHEYGKHYASNYMNELNLLFKKALRKGDNSAYFYGDYLLVMLPEINEEQVYQFYSRIDDLFKESSIHLDNKEFPIQLKYSAVHVGATPYENIDELIKQAIDGLNEIKDENENFVIQSIIKKKEAG